MAEPSKRGFRRAVIVLAVIGGVFVIGALVAHAIGIVYLLSQRAERAEVAEVPPTAASAPSISGLVSPITPLEPPPATLVDPTGATVGLDAFRGRVAVVNLWAMWCAPCREEMPTLAALQRAYDPADLIVVAVNVDGDPAAETGARAFLADHAPLAFYREPTFRLPFLLPGAGAMPQTVLLDRQGRIRAWKTGAADWSGPEARAAVDALLAEPA